LATLTFASRQCVRNKNTNTLVFIYIALFLALFYKLVLKLYRLWSKRLSIEYNEEISIDHYNLWGFIYSYTLTYIYT